MLRTRSAIIAFFFLITVLTFFLVFSKFFNEILIFYLGIFFCFDIFLLFLYFSISDTKKTSLKIKPIYAKIFLYSLTLASVGLVLLIPPYKGSILELGRIPLANWLRYFSSLLLTRFSRLFNPLRCLFQVFYEDSSPLPRFRFPPPFLVDFFTVFKPFTGQPTHLYSLLSCKSFYTPLNSKVVNSPLQKR